MKKNSVAPVRTVILASIFAATVLNSCAIFQKPLVKTDLPRAKAELQKIRTVGYMVQCQGTLNRRNSGQGPTTTCGFNFSDFLGKDEAINASLVQLMQENFPAWKWIPLEPSFKTSAAFNRCYKKLMFLESAVFQQCMNDLDSRKKIQTEFKLDAIVYFKIKVDAQEQEKLNMVLLVPGVHDLNLEASFDYDFQLGNASVENLIISDSETKKDIVLSSYTKVGTQFVHSNPLINKSNILFVKTKEYLSGVKSRAGLL